MTVIPQESIPTAADDGNETNATTWDEPFTQFKAGRESATSWHGGMRFTTIPVPQGATIDSATLTIDVYIFRSGASLALKGNDIDNAVAWSTTRPSQMTQTTASGALPTTTGPVALDIKDIVQEIVDRGSWASNNAMGFAFMNLAATGAYKAHFIDNYHATAAADEALLDITYTAGGAAASFPPTQPWINRSPHLRM